MIDEYLIKIKDYIDLIDKKALSYAINSIKNCIDRGNHIYTIGNGGSLATAMHLSEDLMLSNRLIGKVISLSNPTALTAASNDYGYENSFLNQLHKLLEKGDILIALSASGKSPNIISSIKYAKSIGIEVIGFSGFDGGDMLDICDINLYIPSNKGEYELTEDIHLIMCHIISKALKDL